MNDPIDPTELLRAADPARNHTVDPQRVEQMLNWVTADPPGTLSLLHSWKMRAAAAIAAAAAVAVPVTLALSSGSTPPVLNFAAASHAPSSASMTPRPQSATALGAPIADLVPVSYHFVAGANLTTGSGPAGVYRITGGADPRSELTDLAGALGLSDGVESASASGWSIAGSNAVLTASALTEPVAMPEPVPLGIPKASAGPATSTTDPTPATTTPTASTSLPVDVAPNSVGATSSGASTDNSITVTTSSAPSTTATPPGSQTATTTTTNDPLAWTYTITCNAASVPPSSSTPQTGEGIAFPPTCAASSGASGSATSDQLTGWSTPLVEAIESKSLVPAPASLGTPTVDTSSNTISYPYDFNVGSASGGVTDRLGADTDLTFQFSDSGDLVSASGVLASTTLLDSYPLVSEVTAADSVTAVDLVSSAEASPGTIMTVTPTSEPSSSEPPSQPADNVPSSNSTSTTITAVPESGSGVGTMPVDTVPVDTAPVDTVPVDTAPVDTVPVDTAPVDTVPVDTAPVDTLPVETVPIDTVPISATTSTLPGATTPPSQPAAVTETLETARLSYSVEFLTDGSAVLVPAYTFTASDGSVWRVIALDPADFKISSTGS